MGIDNKGVATCSHCGARISLFTIFNRHMQGLANVWRRKHERACAKRTPQQRWAWARPFIAKGENSSIDINPDHPGMRTAVVPATPSIDPLFAAAHYQDGRDLDHSGDGGGEGQRCELCGGPSLGPKGGCSAHENPKCLDYIPGGAGRAEPSCDCGVECQDKRDGCRYRNLTRPDHPPLSPTPCLDHSQQERER